MKLNKRLTALGIVLLILVWAGNITYYKKHVLTEPLFIKHYYDIKKGMSSFRLFYIQNINSKDSITSIVLPEISNQPVNFNEHLQNTDNRYYALKAITLVFNYNTQKIPEEYNNKIVTKAEVTFSNGKVMDVNIGKIYLNSDGIIGDNLKQTSASSSSDNSGSATLKATRDIVVTGISSKYYDDIKDILNVFINNKPVSSTAFPLKFKAGETLYITYSMSLSNKDIRKNNIYDFTIDFLSEDIQGHKDTSSCFVNYYLQFPGDYDIDTLKGYQGVE